MAINLLQFLCKFFEKLFRYLSPKICPPAKKQAGKQ